MKAFSIAWGGRPQDSSNQHLQFNSTQCIGFCDVVCRITIGNACFAPDSSTGGKNFS
jgi:hypothetical protein